MSDRRITGAALAAFEAQLRAEEKSPLTIIKYMREVRVFLERVGECALGKDDVIAYKEALGCRYKASSANSKLAALNAFFRFAGWRELCVRQLKLQKQTFCRADRELTEKEYRRLVRAAERKGNKRLTLILQTICGTGMRISELRYVTVEAVRRGEIMVACKGKVRSIFIVRALRKKLLRYAEARRIAAGVIFVTRRGAPLDRSNVWREMKALCGAAGVAPGKVFPHNLRHLFARMFYALERDIAKLSDVLGHSSISTTRLYIISTGREHRRMMERMHLIL